MAEENNVNKKPTVKLVFAPGQPAGGLHPKSGEPLPPSATLEISSGAYSRKFNANEQPFDAEAIEEAPFLLRTGYFAVADSAKAQRQANKSKDQAQTTLAGRENADTTT